MSKPGNGSDPWQPLVRTRLAALREKKPARKSAQIRALWPDIKAALDNGHSLKAVCECLEASDITVTVAALAVYIGRIRKKDGALDQGVKGATDSSAMLRDRSHPTTTDAGTRHSAAPFANVGESAANGRPFDYRPELADPTKLI